MMKNIVFLLMLLSVILSSCNEYTPKPKAYPRIERQKVELAKFEQAAFSFQYPSSAKIEEVKDTHQEGFWFNILYPEFDAVIYCTYLPITKKTLGKALDDSYQLAYSHASKADGISQVLYSNPLHHAFGGIYNIEGAVAVPVQFYVTDSVSNFLRGSLYFNQIVNADSIAPVRDFLRNDIVSIMESLEWGSVNTKNR